MVVGIAIGFVLGQFVVAYELPPFVSVLFAPVIIVLIGVIELARTLGNNP